MKLLDKCRFSPGGEAPLFERFQDVLQAGFFVVISEGVGLGLKISLCIQDAFFPQDRPYPGLGASLPATGDLELHDFLCGLDGRQGDQDRENKDGHRHEKGGS